MKTRLSILIVLLLTSPFKIKHWRKFQNPCSSGLYFIFVFLKRTHFMRVIYFCCTSSTKWSKWATEMSELNPFLSLAGNLKAFIYFLISNKYTDDISIIEFSCLLRRSKRLPIMKDAEYYYQLCDSHNGITLCTSKFLMSICSPN